MQIRRFIEVLSENKHLLGEVNPDKWSYAVCERPITGCPLRVVVGAALSPQEILRVLFCGAGTVACNPGAEEAADYLEIDTNFARGVTSGWDTGVCYMDSSRRKENLREFAGFLVSTIHRPVIRALPQG